MSSIENDSVSIDSTAKTTRRKPSSRRPKLVATPSTPVSTLELMANESKLDKARRTITAWLDAKEAEWTTEEDKRYSTATLAKFVLASEVAYKDATSAMFEALRENFQKTGLSHSNAVGVRVGEHIYILTPRDRCIQESDAFRAKGWVITRLMVGELIL